MIAFTLFGWVFVCIRSSLHSVRFGKLLRCAHKRIVNIMKVYIEGKSMQVDSVKNITFIHVYFCEARNSMRLAWIVVTT